MRWSRLSRDANKRFVYQRCKALALIRRPNRQSVPRVVALSMKKTMTVLFDFKSSIVKSRHQF